MNGEFGTRDLGPHKNSPGISYNIQLAPGPFGQPSGSILFSGTPFSYIEFPNNGGLDVRYSLTILFWVFPENVDGPMISFGTDHYNVNFWIANGGTWSRLMARHGGGSGVAPRNSLNHYSWNYIGFSYDYDTGVQKVWKDGKVCNAASVGQFELKTQDAIRMGVKDGDERFLKGRISCFQVYDRVLTEREVQAARGLCFKKGWLTPWNGRLKTLHYEFLW